MALPWKREESGASSWPAGEGGGERPPLREGCILSSDFREVY